MSNFRNIPIEAREFIERDFQHPADFGRTPDMDIAGRQGEAARLAPPGEPSMDYGVRSVYDVRPVNAYDFNIDGVFAAEGPLSQALCTMTVPRGKIAVLRKIGHVIEPAPAFTLRSDVLITLRRSGADLPFNVDIPIGLSTVPGEIVTCFAIADENETLEAFYEFSAAIAGVFEVHTHFYGQFLAKLGRPPQFEIANPGGGPGEVRVPPAFIPPVQSPIPVQPTTPLGPAPSAAAQPPRFRSKFITRRT